MAIWRPFGYEGKPGTCLWCGRKLRRETVLCEELEKDLLRQGVSAHRAYKQALKPAPALGAYQDNSFCGLRCGYQFGLRMARLGRRLAPASTRQIERLKTILDGDSLPLC